MDRQWRWSEYREFRSSFRQDDAPQPCRAEHYYDDNDDEFANDDEPH